MSTEHKLKIFISVHLITTYRINLLNFERKSKNEKKREPNWK